MNLSFLTASQSLSERYLQMKPALILLVVILTVLTVCCIIFTYLGYRTHSSRRGKHIQKTIQNLMYVATAVVLVCVFLCFMQYRNVGNVISAGNFQDPVVPGSSETTGNTEDTKPSETTEQTEPQTKPVEIPEPTFTPAFTDSSNPEQWDIKWEIISNGAIVDSFQRENPISFGAPEDYFALPGVATFRGNNFRDNPVYGTATVTEKTISKLWGRDIGSLNGWTGSGWTGQPLIVQWDEETKAIMNLYSPKKEKADLVEVIYATLDGYVYFYDLDDGTYTRDPLYIGMNFKGAGALDPRGYPIMYVGSGVSIGNKSPRMYAISLIDGSILYERSGSDAFSLRSFVAFDSSPLVDAETDTLIWPGESGILYTIKLNTNYDKAAGTLTMAPEETVKIRYSPARYTSEKYWIGFEPSAVIVDRYLYISENGGMFFCIDLNTMELVWAQDTRDDSNCTPVFEWNGLDGGYIYTAPSLHWTNVNGSGYICIYKLDAKTGEIVWEHKIDCQTVVDVSGGIQSSPLLGKPGTELEGMILFTVARTPGVWDGKLIALDTETGNLIWSKSLDCFAWSSPVAIYDENGKAYIITSDSIGNMVMWDAQGNVLSSLDLGSNVEASPAVFNNTLVVGTRGQQIFGIKIK